MKALLLIFSLLLILLLIGLWVGSGSYPQRWELEKRAIAQEAANTDRKDQIKKIQADLEDVKSGNAAIEERARSELGMTGKGETFFEVILQPDEKEVSHEVGHENNEAGHNNNDKLNPKKDDPKEKSLE